ncbi:MAG TPA: hypothetical protein VFQ22_12010 [Longimicrobiales bacterium]|nr:hypothetical protein [Longimicrobiales bacterium]
MISLSGTAAVLAVATLATTAPGIEAQSAAERSYFEAVARYFGMPSTEVAILADWDLPAEEIPVVLFLARRSGVSAEALVALRESGHSWTSLADRYGVRANTLHVPVRDPSSAGAFSGLYQRFQSTPVGQWTSIPLTDEDIIALVNVRVLSSATGVSPDDILRRTSVTSNFVDLYAQLLR